MSLLNIIILNSYKVAIWFFLNIILISHLNAQTIKFKYIKLSPSIWEARLDSSYIKALTVWDSYLALTSQKRSVYNHLYWFKEETKIFSRDCDMTYRYVDYSPKRDSTNYYKPTVLAVEQIGNDFFIKTMFSRNTDPVAGVFIANIIDIYAKKQGGSYFLCSALFENSKYLKRYEGKTIALYKTSDSTDSKLIDKLDSINHYMASLYRIPPLHINYFLTNSKTEMQKIRGFDFERTMYISTKKGTPQTGALSEGYNKLIINGTPDPLINFMHELAHIYTYQIFAPKNYDRTYHEFFNEGFSTFIGGTAERSLSQLLETLQKDLSKNTYKFNFSNLLDFGPGIGEEDAILSYILGGLICKLAYDKEGMDGIFKLLQGGWQDEDLYRTVESVLGVKRENLDSFIRNELKKYAR